ncbi:MAG: sensor histidine kinase [Eubacteriaceae bacterium]|jgi:two-component system LytT family sensor kinase
MKRDHLFLIFRIVILFLAVLLLFLLGESILEEQATMSTPLLFRGNYRENGGEWKTIEADTDLSSLNGDITFRGSPIDEIEKGIPINFYLDHISVSFSVNGKEISHFGPMEGGAVAETCGMRWVAVESPGIKTTDIVEIKVHNPHLFDNSSAYNEFINSFYTLHDSLFRTVMVQRAGFFYSCGTIIIVLSLMLMLATVTFREIRKFYGQRILYLELFAMLIGIYLLADTEDQAIWGKNLIFTTFLLNVSIVLALFVYACYIVGLLTGKRKKTANFVIATEAVIMLIIAVVCLTRQMLLYDAMFLWLVGQVVLSPILGICCFLQIRKNPLNHKLQLAMCSVLCMTMGLDCINDFFDWWPHGITSKILFLIYFMVGASYFFRQLVDGYRAREQADKLENDLKDSHGRLALSQIKNHFIFNVLNAISGLCKSDPARADEAIIRFSRFLRMTIDVMQDDRPYPFTDILQHLEDYIALEQIRFGDRIKFETDIGFEDFMMTPLILQPVLENAIKHGILPRKEGGTVTLRTWRDADSVYVSISEFRYIPLRSFRAMQTVFM